MVVAALLVAAPASAQGRPIAPGAFVTSCTKATRTVTNGRPRHKQTAALEYLSRCGKQGATVMASVLAETRTETDTIALRDFHYLLYQWRDAEVMAAALALARDGSATPQSRGFAIMHLMGLVYPHSAFGYGRLIRGREVLSDDEGGRTINARCEEGRSGTAPGLVGTPLPSNRAETIRSALKALAADSSAPLSVRNAASCLS